MKHRNAVRTRRRSGLIGLCLAVIALFGLVAIAPVADAAGPHRSATASTVPAWTGTFDSFHSPGWNSSWGLTSDSQQCPIAVGTYSCNWGYQNLKPISDPTSPAGQALQVTYPAKSGPPSCTVSSSSCVLGGGQFYQDLTSNGQTALATSPTIDLKYSYKFPVGFDFGGKTAGKMPGLYGGPPGCESGGQHCSNGWSTRYMWRGGSSSAPNGELYFYGGSGSGFGADLCLGNWTFPADGAWHSMEQLVNTGSGAITVWSDGKQVCQTTQSFASPASGVFFSTFHGGHDTSWSPSKTTTSEFSDFSLATNGPQSPAPTGPATPSGLAVTGATSSSLNLSWSEVSNGDPAASYKVYEGGTVVATATGTSATITGLAAGSSHTYTVTAVDAAGSESGHSTAVTGSTSGGTGGPATPTGLSVSGATNSSLNLSWNEANNSDPAVAYHVYEGTTLVASPTTTSTTVTGLAAGSTHSYTVAAVDANGLESAQSAAATGTTTGGVTAPAAPSGLTVSGATSTSLDLSWTETNNSDPATSYKVYEGSTVVATATGTKATISGLTAGTTHTYAVTAVDASGVESAQSASATGTTSPSGGGGLTVSIAKTKDWGTGYTDTATVTNNSGSAVNGWNVQFSLDPSMSIESQAGVSTTVSGSYYTLTNLSTDAAIAAGGSQTFQFSGDYGSSGYLAPTGVLVDGQSGGAAPAAPTGLAVTGSTADSLTLGWTEAGNSDPAVSYNVYAGGSVVATSTTTSATVSGLAAGSTHAYTVTAVDAAGVESAHSSAASGTTSGSGGGALTVSIAKTNDWGSGFTDTVTLTNNSGSAVNGWNVQFDLDPAMNIESASNAGYSSSGTHWTLGNGSSDATIAPGATLTFEFSGDYGSAGYLPPTNVSVNGQGSGATSPAVPSALNVTGSTASSISLGWTETNNNDPAVSYHVYEGGTLVATATSTSATITGLAACASHSYTVAAVDAAGVESGRSGSVTGTTSGCVNTPATPTGLAVTATTSSSISLSWSETNNSDPAASYKVYEGGTVVATPTTTSATLSGLTAASSHTYTVTAVDASGAESGHSSSVTGTTSSSGGGSAFSQALIDSAVAAPPFAWAAPTSSVPRPGTNPANIGESKVLYYLALVDRQAPGSQASNGTSVDSALLTQVRSLIAGGHEPDADGGLEMWGQAPVAQALLLLKNGPAWSELTAAEQNKVSLLEAAMGYGSNYAYNDANNFSSGICGFGNFAKGNNPNYRDGGVDTEIAAIQFFGASSWDSMLSSFDDATVAAQLNAAGLTNAGGCFTTAGSAANSAIARPFLYQGHHSSDLMGLWSTLAGNTFDKTAQSTVGTAHIADGTTSPYDGQCCMGHEFNSTDSSGLRSSALYVFEGWMNVTGSRVVMSVLGNFSLSAASTESQFHIGTLDLKYKLDHGYLCQALNQPGILVDDHGNPSTDGPNVKGFLYDWDAYSVSGAPQS